MLPFPARRGRPAAADRARTVFLFLALAMLIGWLLVNLKFIFMPLLLAIFGVFLLSPLVEGLRRLGLPRPLAVILILAGVAALVWLGGRYVMGSFLAFRDGFPKYEEGLVLLIGQARDLTDYLPFITVESLQSALSGISLGRLVGNALNSIFTGLGYLLAALVFLLYFLSAYPSMPGRLRRAFPDQRGPLLSRAFEDIGRQVQRYIMAKTASSLLTGLGVTLTCLFFGLDFAVTWGVFGAALNFVPNLGSILTVLPPAAVALVQPELGDLSSALGLAAVLTLVMVLNGSVLEPLMLERNVNLSPTASLLALFLWGWLWGVMGLIVAVPAMVVVKFTCDNIESLRPIGVLLSAKAGHDQP